MLIYIYSYEYTLIFEHYIIILVGITTPRVQQVYLKEMWEHPFIQPSFGFSLWIQVLWSKNSV